MEAIKIVEEYRDSLLSKNTIVELSKEGTTEHQRGVIVGKLDAITIILNKLTAKRVKDEDSSVRR